jgi:hypothetical protein
MEHQLSIMVGHGRDKEGHQLLRQINLVAETNLEARPLGFPDAFGGTLLGAQELLHEIATNDYVEVGFLGKRYKFTRLEADGTFEVRQDW